MSTTQDNDSEASATKPDPNAKKPVVRRRPAGMKPAAPAANPPTFVETYPRPETPHDRYLTYDSKGKLITHTMYYAPPSNKPVVLVFPKSKKHKTPK